MIKHILDVRSDDKFSMAYCHLLILDLFEKKKSFFMYFLFLDAMIIIYYEIIVTIIAFLS